MLRRAEKWGLTAYGWRHSALGHLPQPWGHAGAVFKPDPSTCSGMGVALREGAAIESYPPGWCPGWSSSRMEQSTPCCSLLRETAATAAARVPGAVSGPLRAFICPHGSGLQRDGVADHRKLKNRIANPHPIFMVQLMAFTNPAAVHEGPIGAGQVADEVTLRTVHGDFGMLA